MQMEQETRVVSSTKGEDRVFIEATVQGNTERSLDYAMFRVSQALVMRVRGVAKLCRDLGLHEVVLTDPDLVRIEWHQDQGEDNFQWKDDKLYVNQLGAAWFTASGAYSDVKATTAMWTVDDLLDGKKPVTIGVSSDVVERAARHPKKMWIRLSGTIRCEYSELVEVPPDISDKELQELVEARYDSIGAEDYEDMADTWKRGLCECVDADPRAGTPVLRVSRAFERLQVQEIQAEGRFVTTREV